jgi:hypothetical protein
LTHEQIKQNTPIASLFVWSEASPTPYPDEDVVSFKKFKYNDSYLGLLAYTNRWHYSYECRRVKITQNLLGCENRTDAIYRQFELLRIETDDWVVYEIGLGIKLVLNVADAAAESAKIAANITRLADGKILPEGLLHFDIVAGVISDSSSLYRMEIKLVIDPFNHFEQSFSSHPKYLGTQEFLKGKFIKT